MSFAIPLLALGAMGAARQVLKPKARASDTPFSQTILRDYDSLLAGSLARIDGANQEEIILVRDGGDDCAKLSKCTYDQAANYVRDKCQKVDEYGEPDSSAACDVAVKVMERIDQGYDKAKSAYNEVKSWF